MLSYERLYDSMLAEKMFSVETCIIEFDNSSHIQSHRKKLHSFYMQTWNTLHAIIKY